MSSTRNAQHSRSSSRLTVFSLICLSLLLAPPSMALSRARSFLDARLLFGGWFAVSMISFFIYRSDKLRAEAGAWRIPESTLHILELVGGWPGAFLAQHIFRHKISKLSYQVLFWSIVLVYQLIAIDSLFDWRFTRSLLHRNPIQVVVPS